LTESPSAHSHTTERVSRTTRSCCLQSLSHYFLPWHCFPERHGEELFSPLIISPGRVRWTQRGYVEILERHAQGTQPTSSPDHRSPCSRSERKGHQEEKLAASLSLSSSLSALRLNYECEHPQHNGRGRGRRTISSSCAIHGRLKCLLWYIPNVPPSPPPFVKKNFLKTQVIEPQFSRTFESHCEKKSTLTEPSPPPLHYPSSHSCHLYVLLFLFLSNPKRDLGCLLKPLLPFHCNLSQIIAYQGSHHRQDEDRRERREGGMNCTCLTVRNHLLILLLLLLILFNNL
jgi:hypothetical protein